MVARNIPGVRKKQLGNRDVEDLEKILQNRGGLAKGGSTVDLRKVPGSNERRTGIPADTRSRSQRGTLPPNSLSVPKGTTGSTYTARGKTYTRNPNDTTDIFLRNHPVLAGLKGPAAKNKFLVNHPKISKRASQVTNSGGPALGNSANATNYRDAILRRMKRKVK